MRSAFPTAALAAVATILALGHAAPAGAVRDAGSEPVQIVIGFVDRATAADQTKALADAGVAREDSIPKLDVVVATEKASEVTQTLAELRADPDVEYAERDGIARTTLVPTDATYATSSWPFVKPSFPGAWDATTGSASIVVAVLDTGVQANHPDLAGALVAGWDFVGGDSTPTDVYGHGTAVAGTIAARLGGGPAVGTCPGCSIMPVKVMGDSGSGSWSDIAAGILWATDHGAEIINMSLGGGSGGTVMTDALTYATARNVLVVVSAGNAGTTNPVYPAYYAKDYPAVLSVAATDQNDALYSWSSRGAAWAELAAPGCLYTSLLGGGTGSICGTSFSAPITAGAAGLLLSYRSTLTAAQVGAAITSSATTGLGLDVTTGRLNALAALTAVGWNNPGGGPPVGPPADTTAPTAPPGLALVTATTTSLAVRWNASTDAVGVTGYGLFADGSSVATAASAARTYTFAGLACGRTYQLGVDATDAAANHSARSLLNARTAACPPDRTPPAAPPSLELVSRTDTTLGVLWTTASDNVGVTGYGLYLGSVRVVTVPAATRSYSFVAGLACARTYQLGVDAVDAAGNRSPRRPLTATTAACPPDTTAPRVPPAFKGTGKTRTTVSVGWSAASDNVAVTGYGLYVDGVRVASLAAGARTFVFTGLRCADTQDLGLDAVDAAGNRSARATLTPTTLACPPETVAPSAPVAFASAASRSSITVRWNPSTDNVGVTGYRVSLGASLITTVPASGRSLTLMGLPCGRMFQFSVEAVDAAGNRSARSTFGAATSAC